MNKLTPGRPREFDENDVLLRAMQTFLSDGFEAVSYEKISRKMGLSKPSLYNTFGDKLSLFQRVLDSYAVMARVHIMSNFSNQDSLTEAVQNLLRTTAVFYSQPTGPSLGCLLIGTALPASSQYDGVRETLSGFINSLDKLLEETIEVEYPHEAQARGQSSRTLALQISGLIFTLAVRARTGLSTHQLTTCANELAEIIEVKSLN